MKTFALASRFWESNGNRPYKFCVLYPQTFSVIQKYPKTESTNSGVLAVPGLQKKLSHQNKLFLWMTVNCIWRGYSSSWNIDIEEYVLWIGYVLLSSLKWRSTPQRSRTGPSPSDALVTYPGHWWGGLTPLEKCRWCILMPQPTGWRNTWYQIIIYHKVTTDELICHLNLSINHSTYKIKRTK